MPGYQPNARPKSGPKSGPKSNSKSGPKSGPKSDKRTRPPSTTSRPQKQPQKQPENHARRKADRQRGTATSVAAARPAPLVILYGRNSVRAALANKRRKIIEFHGSSEQFRLLAAATQHSLPEVTPAAQSAILASLEREGVPHQSVALVCHRLPPWGIGDLLASLGSERPAFLLILDRVVDPQNVGAAMRVATAMGVAALITQDRNAPGESGALARAAAGTLDQIPWVRVGNLSRTLAALKRAGFWVVGLDSRAATLVGEADPGDRVALVVGSEAKGLRPTVAAHCDIQLAIPMAPAVESLNVSVAAAIALYALKDNADKKTPRDASR